ncbi:MAG TPA: DsbA family protein [Noviherbaspirillum sp.]|uniref:DsbA family protein n=1 Tax=Noviherbaspirillum sp. TaxID=1926288 RepID=UPI002D5F5B41|nr:DsbA family protein [Noviherbaspirillum sp.]HYD94841.1 DsbA family protein [Noviherbaspirillum sp.]
MPSLIYIADPMCSWCYGFGPELAALMEGVPELPVEVVVGGLRAYKTEVVDAALKQEQIDEWKKVAQQTNLPFDYNALARENFAYNTEPACRAVVAARLLAPQTCLYVLHEIQRRFFSEGKDVTQGEVLAEIATVAMAEQGVNIDKDTFLATWSSDVAIKAANDDFLLVHKWKVTGFPTLILERNGVLDLVISGYVPMPKLIDLLQSIIDKEQAA